MPSVTCSTCGGEPSKRTWPRPCGARRPGGGGFIGSTLVERLVREGAACAGVRPLQRRAATAADWTTSRTTCWPRSTSTPAISRTPRPSTTPSSGCDAVLHLGALIPDPVLLPAPARVSVRQRRRDDQRPRGEPAGRCLARACRCPSSEVYGTAQVVTDPGVPPAYAAIALCGDQGGGRPARAYVLALVRPARGGGAPVQHVRPASVGTCR